MLLLFVCLFLEGDFFFFFFFFLVVVVVVGFVVFYVEVRVVDI